MLLVLQLSAMMSYKLPNKKEIENLLETREIVTSKGKNQVGTVKRAGDTRWVHISTLFVA